MGFHVRRLRRRRGTRRAEVEQMYLQDRELEAVTEEEQIYLHERLDERVETAAHPEQADRVAQLVADVLEGHLAVRGGVVEEEVDRQLQAGFDARLDDLEVHLGPGVHRPDQLDDRNLLAVAVGVEEQSVEQLVGRPAVDDLAQTGGVVAEFEVAVDLDGSADDDRDGYRSDHERAEAVLEAGRR